MLNLVPIVILLVLESKGLSRPLSMLQHLKSRSMAVFKNNFECPCNVHAAEQHSLLHPLQNISQSHTKDLTLLDI